MRMLAAAGAALTLMIAVPAGAASLVTAPSAIAPDSGVITIQSPQAVQRGNVVVRRPQGGAVVRGPRGGAAVRGPRGNVVVAPGRRGYVGGPVRRGNVAGGVAAGVAAGLIGGALLGGLAQPEPEPVYVAPRRRVVVEEEDEPVYYERPRCMSFRSYDPRTGTFIDRNGIERVCR
jgi:hypothetical protein